MAPRAALDRRAANSPVVDTDAVLTTTLTVAQTVLTAVPTVTIAISAKENALRNEKTIDWLRRQ